MGQRRKAALCAALLCCSMWTMRLARAQDAPDYPTIGAALLELGLTMASYFLTVANLTSLVQDPNTNAILLVPTNAGLQQAITDYQAQRTLQDMARTRLISLLMIFPQPPGTVHGALNPTDGLIMDTLLTSSTDYPGQLNTTLTRLTFRDNGDGRWYVASSPPGAIVNLSLTYTAGNARIYQLEGMIGPPSDVFKPPDVLVHIYSIAEALQDQPVLSTYLTLAKADAALWPMFANGSETCTTIFPATNSAWQTYFTSIGTTLDSFKGTPAAHDLLAASIMTNRPYMVQQLPAGLTQAKDLLGRTVQMQSDGIPDPNNTVSLIGTKNPGGLSILPAPLRNIRAGKSVLQAIGDVLIPDNSTLPGAAGSVTPVAAPAAAPSDTSGSSSHKSTGVIVGLTVGITAGVALVALAAGFIMRHRRRAASKAAGNGFDWGFAEKGAAGWMQARLTADTDSVVVVGPASPGAHMDIPGVHKGMFTRMVAHEYTWTDMIPEPGQCVSVESGVNDRELDSLAQGEGAPQDCPVVKLSKEDVKEQIQLLRHGVLGKGATAMVFQCVWPSRFGPDALLAVKVLKEGSDADPHHLSSFAYEAAVLESLVHPNVVRLYGYCLEPPCVCIILELLPLSLKQLLYDTDPTAALLSSPSGMVSQGATQTRVSHHPLSGTSLSHAAVKSLLANLPPAMGQDASHNNSPDTTGSPEPPEEGKHSAHSMEAVSEAGGVKHSAHSVEVTIHEGGGDQPLTAVRKLTVLQVLSISNDIAAGLAHMHNSSHGAAALAEHCLFEEHSSCGQRARVVHRDLKPANILINSRGQAKISDFGLARQHHQTTIATAHVGAGTLPYMAPELLIHASGQGYAATSATNRVDIYSLAMIMWEMLAGHTPWQGSADAALVIAVTQGRRPPLPEPLAVEPPLEPGLLQREAGPDVVPQFNAVVRACWRQRELKRPTAVAVHHKLCQLLTDMGVPTSSQVVHAVDGHEQGQDEVSLGMPPTMSL